MSIQPDPVMTRIGEGISLHQQGDAPAARALFEQVWEDLSPDGNPLHRCALAHAMADVRDDPEEELRWDLRALDAARELTDERVSGATAVTTVRAFLPSLHLNLADVYLRLGQRDASAGHVESAAAALDALPRDGYREMIEQGLARVRDELG
ncbi:MAG: hypothetical protein ACYC2O_09495 [Microthrixaceae bacterium]